MLKPVFVNSSPSAPNGTFGRGTLLSACGALVPAFGIARFVAAGFGTPVPSGRGDTVPDACGTAGRGAAVPVLGGTLERVCVGDDVTELNGATGETLRIAVFVPEDGRGVAAAAGAAGRGAASMTVFSSDAATCGAGVGGGATTAGRGATVTAAGAAVLGGGVTFGTAMGLAAFAPTGGGAGTAGFAATAGVVGATV